MKRKNLQNERLDQIGCRLLKAARVRDEEIERIISAPQVFSAVRARIKAEQQAGKSKKIFGRWEALSVWNRQKNFAVWSFLTFFVIGIAGLIFFNKLNHQAKQVYVPVFKPQVSSLKVAQSPALVEDAPEIEVTRSPAVKPEMTAKQIDFKKETLKPQKPEAKPAYIKKPQYTENQPTREFYALSYTGNPNDPSEDMRIVRTELSRSALFALGVNLPIENESEKIKTDLLVGADGIPRAIRLADQKQ